MLGLIELSTGGGVREFEVAGTEQRVRHRQAEAGQSQPGGSISPQASSVHKVARQVFDLL